MRWPTSRDDVRQDTSRTQRLLWPKATSMFVRRDTDFQNSVKHPRATSVMTTLMADGGSGKSAHAHRAASNTVKSA